MSVSDKALGCRLFERFEHVYTTSSDDHRSRYNELQNLLAEVDGLEEIGLGCALLFKAALKQLVHASPKVPFDKGGSRGGRAPVTCVVSIQAVDVLCCSTYSF